MSESDWISSISVNSSSSCSSDVGVLFLILILSFTGLSSLIRSRCSRDNASATTSLPLVLNFVVVLLQPESLPHKSGGGIAYIM